jgi:taurine dioxygenase
MHQNGMTITPLSDVLGAEITGVTIGKGMDDALFGAIEDALHEHLVVVIRDQDIKPSDFVAFAKRFGPPEPHVIDQFHHAADPNILILSNRKDEAGNPVGLADGGSYFHTDYSYLAVPARCTILYGIELPDDNAGTTFADQRAAYAALDDATKARIDPLICRHHYGNRDDLDRTSRTVASPLTADQEAKMKWERHPLVRSHPKTGRKSLYAVSGSSFGIDGMDDAESLELLDTLKQHSTSARFCYQPTYRKGDIVIWDNCSLLHCAPLVDPTIHRTLWRITVKEEGPTL